eukprot:symbB.v1.2.008985.t1/scaffold506.1/size199467/10
MYIGLGLTEAGIEHNGRSILDLAEFLYACFESPSRGHTLCVLNTDNVPFNGDAIRSYVCSCDFTQNIERSTEFETWLKKHVCFHNAMVDRITSQREGCPDVPRAEPGHSTTQPKLGESPRPEEQMQKDADNSE